MLSLPFIINRIVQMFYLNERLSKISKNSQIRRQQEIPAESSCDTLSKKKSITFQEENDSIYIHDSSYQDSQSSIIDSQQSVVSLEETLMQEHLVYLEVIISKIDGKISNTEMMFDQTPQETLSKEQTDMSFIKYLRNQKSMIPHLQIPYLLKFLQRNESFKKVLKWIYQYVRVQVGDELILIAHKILLAFMPVKTLINNRQELLSLAAHPFNILNIYSDYRLELLNFSHLYKLGQKGLEFNHVLFEFYQNFLKTILLVLQQYSQNPGYAIITAQEQQKKSKKQAEIQKNQKCNKTKKIKKEILNK